MTVSRQFLAVVGDLVIYHNRSLRQLILTCYTNVISHLTGSDDLKSVSNDFEFGSLSPADKEMLDNYKTLIRRNSMLILFVI